jgi:hypothetical protein
MNLNEKGKYPWPRDNFLAFDQGQIRELEGRVPRPHVIGIRQAEVVVEAMSSGQEFDLMTQVPLAVDGRRVATGLEHVGNGLF